jgi:hypothetical protein
MLREVVLSSARSTAAAASVAGGLGCGALALSHVAWMASALAWLHAVAAPAITAEGGVHASVARASTAVALADLGLAGGGAGGGGAGAGGGGGASGSAPRPAAASATLSARPDRAATVIDDNNIWGDVPSDEGDTHSVADVAARTPPAAPQGANAPPAPLGARAPPTSQPQLNPPIVIAGDGDDAVEGEGAEYEA